MFILLFNPILAFDEQKLPRRWGSFELVKRTVTSSQKKWAYKINDLFVALLPLMS
jgi:hypothetical protein